MLNVRTSPTTWRETEPVVRQQGCSHGVRRRCNSSRGCCPSRQGSSAAPDHPTQVPGVPGYTRSIRSIALLGALAVLLVFVGPAAGAGRRQPRRRPPTSPRPRPPSSSPRTASGRSSWRGTPPGLLPTMSSFLKKGTFAAGNRLLTQAPPNTGAGWYSLATGALARRPRLDEQHLSHQRPALRQPHRVVRRQRAAGGVDRPGGGTGWSQGRPGRVGRRPQRLDQGPTIDFRSFLSGRGVATNFIGTSGDLLFDDAPFIAAFGPGSTTRAAMRGRRVPRCRTRAGDRLDERTAADLQPARGAPARARLRRRQVRAERLDLRQHERRRHELRQGLLARRRGRRRRDPAQGPVGRRQGHDPGRRAERSPPGC